MPSSSQQILSLVWYSIRIWDKPEVEQAGSESSILYCTDDLILLHCSWKLWNGINKHIQMVIPVICCWSTICKAVYKTHLSLFSPMVICHERCCCCSTAKSCPALRDFMDCSILGSLVLHYLLEFAQTHIHFIQWCHPTISSSVTPISSCPQSVPATGSFQMSQFFTSGGQSIGASASAFSFLPMTDPAPVMEGKMIYRN